MSTEYKRFTVSVTPNMAKKLDKAKQERYYNQAQSQMVRDLIARGLAVLEKEQGDGDNKGCLMEAEKNAEASTI